jgi:hypothetical protein
MNTNINKYFEVIEIRYRRERFGCSEHQPFQKKKGEGLGAANLFMFFVNSTLESMTQFLRNDTASVAREQYFHCQ